MITQKTISPDQIQEATRAKRLAVVSKDAPSKLKLFERVFRGEASPRQAIKAYCCECQSFATAAIRDCPTATCPLFKYRPYQKQGEVVS